MDDIESEWAYEEDPFDVIHARHLAFSIRDYGELIKQCYRYVNGPFPVWFLDSLTKNRSVKPSGCVEFQDWDAYPISEDGSLDGTGLQRYYDEVYGAFEEAGYEVHPGPKLEQWFRDAGFVNIHVEKIFIPYGVWPKDPYLVSFPLPLSRNISTDLFGQKKVGAWAQAQAEAALEGGALTALTRHKQWTKEEVMLLTSEARADGRRRDIHMMLNL